MAERDQIVARLDALLDSPGFPDYGPNGLQVPGNRSIERVVSGVSATLELLERAAASGAEAVLVHHGLFWGDAGPLDQLQADRLRVLLSNEISLIAYHLPLDAHPELGNNALLIKALGLTQAEPFGLFKGRNVGFVAESDGISGEELAARIERELERPPLHLPHGPAEIRRIGVISGSAPDEITAAAAAGCDAFITGEPAERVNALARELGLHFYAAGHHATERFGVQALGALLAEEFGLQHEFVEIPNPI